MLFFICHCEEEEKRIFFEIFDAILEVRPLLLVAPAPTTCALVRCIGACAGGARVRCADSHPFPPPTPLRRLIRPSFAQADKAGRADGSASFGLFSCFGHIHHHRLPKSIARANHRLRQRAGRGPVTGLHGAFRTDTWHSAQSTDDRERAAAFVGKHLGARAARRASSALPGAESAGESPYPRSPEGPLPLPHRLESMERSWSSLRRKENSPPILMEWTVAGDDELSSFHTGEDYSQAQQEAQQEEVISSGTIDVRKVALTNALARADMQSDEAARPVVSTYTPPAESISVRCDTFCGGGF